jgi:hypothetical protein
MFYWLICLGVAYSIDLYCCLITRDKNISLVFVRFDLMVLFYYFYLYILYLYWHYNISFIYYIHYFYSIHYMKIINCWNIRTFNSNNITWWIRYFKCYVNFNSINEIPYICKISLVWSMQILFVFIIINSPTN